MTELAEGRSGDAVRYGSSWRPDGKRQLHYVGFRGDETGLKNAYQTGDVTATGQVLKAVGLKECIRKAADGIGWQKRGKQKNRGIGIACTLKWFGTTPSSAILKVNEDGTINLLIGSVEAGQGVNTEISQVVAEEMGVPVEIIKVSAPIDTDVTPYYKSITGSSTTFSMGNAARRAARDAREQCLNLASSMLGVDKKELAMTDGKVFIRGNPVRKVTLAELAVQSLSRAGVQIIGKGTFYKVQGVADAETSQGYSTEWMFAAHAAEVEVDPETGLVRVVKVSAAHDVGQAINPDSCEGQVDGAIAHAIGEALWEEMLLKDGKVLYPNFTRYRLTTSVDMPKTSVALVEQPLDDAPFGAKGLGEAAMAPTIPAIGNAIYNAVGVRIKSRPITPEKVLAALKGHK